jgi:hypothetical protein
MFACMHVCMHVCMYVLFNKNTCMYRDLDNAKNCMCNAHFVYCAQLHAQCAFFILHFEWVNKSKKIIRKKNQDGW